MNFRETGVWVAIHPSFTEVSQMLAELDKFVLLLKLIENLRWNFNSRGFRLNSIMTQSQTKLDGVLQEVSIRLETTISRLNTSLASVRDYRPIEVSYSWKDGYVVVNNKFIAATIWDLFAIVAGVILTLERAWFTWGRVVQKIVTGRAEVYLMKYPKNSPEWLLMKSILDRATNLVSSSLALRKTKLLERRLDKLEQKRALSEKRIQEKVEIKVNKIKRKLAIKSGVVEASLVDQNMQKIYEWESYRAILRKKIHENEINEVKLEKLDSERMERMRGVESALSSESRSSSRRSKSGKHLQRRRGYLSDSTDSEDTGDGSVSVEEGVKIVSQREHQENVKNKRKKKVTNFNPTFFVDDALESGDKKPAVILNDDVVSGARIWQTNQAGKRHRSDTSTKTLKKPAEWLKDAFREQQKWKVMLETWKHEQHKTSNFLLLEML